jgi:hypothetical protein
MDVLGVMDQIIIDYKTHELHILTGNGQAGTQQQTIEAIGAGHANRQKAEVSG